MEFNKKDVILVPRGDEVYVYNRKKSVGIVMHKDVLEIFRSLEKPEDIFAVANDYECDDKSFLVNMGNLVLEKQLFDFSDAESSEHQINTITYIITDYCNLACKHCAHSAIFQNLNQTKRAPIVADLNIAAALLKLRPRNICITGGEPLMVSNFEEVARYIRQNFDGNLSLSTNATLINDENIDYLCSCFTQFDISIDGINEEKCAAIRGKGVFQTVINAIKKLQSKGVKNISLSIALSNDTISDKEPFEEMCRTLSVKPLIRFMNLSGRAKLNGLTGSDNWLNFERDYSPLPNLCTGGIKQITVNSIGDVFPCNNFLEDEFKIGNVFEDGLSTKFSRSDEHVWWRNFSRYIPLYREECSDCDLGLFCSFCPVLIKTYMDNNSITELSPNCTTKKAKFYGDIFDV